MQKTWNESAYVCQTGLQRCSFYFKDSLIYMKTASFWILHKHCTQFLSFLLISTNTLLSVTGNTILRCHLQCSMLGGKVAKDFRKRSHWHCSPAPQLFDRINEFRTHLASHDAIVWKPPAKMASKEVAASECLTSRIPRDKTRSPRYAPNARRL